MAPEIQTFLLAMTPINELRGTIPFILGLYQMPVWQVFFWAVLGNIFPIFFLLWFWQKFSQLLIDKSLFFKKFFAWLFHRTRNKFYKKYQRFGDLALVIFVGIPLPLTGAWTGSLAAFLFDIPYWRAISLIFLGVLMAGLIVTFISVGVFSLFNIF